MTRAFPSRTRLHTLGLWVGISLVLAAAGPAWAECPRVLQEIERTRNELTSVEDQLRDCVTDQIRGLLDQGRKQLRESERHAQGTDCQRAATHLEAARRLFVKARDLCRDTDHSQDQVLDFLRRTDAHLREAAEAAARGGGECRRLLRAGEDQQAKAWQQFRSGKLRFSLSLSASARRTAERVASCGRGDGAAPGDAHQELERTDRMIEQQPGAGDRLELARRIQAQAWRQLRARDHPGLALRLTELARTVASAGESDRGPGPDGVRNMIQTTSRLVDDLGTNAGSDAAARDLLGRSRQLLDQARRLLRDGNPGAAAAKVGAAATLALTASERLDEAGGR